PYPVQSDVPLLSGSELRGLNGNAVLQPGDPLGVAVGYVVKEDVATAGGDVPVVPWHESAQAIGMTLRRRSSNDVVWSSNRTRIFLNYFDETEMATVLESMNARLTIASPVNHELDSIFQIQRVVNAIVGKADFLIIRNEVHGEGFDLFDKSKLRQKLLSDLGAKEIVVTRMYKWLVESLQRSKLTPTAARNHQDFSIMDRQRLVMWQRQFYEQIDSVQQLLVPATIANGKPSHGNA